MAKHPAAFINEIYESGTKDEAIKWLQRTWDDYLDLKNEFQKLKQHLYAQSVMTDKQIIGACRAIADAALTPDKRRT